MSAIFYHDELQKEMAEKSMETKALEWGKQVWTRILPLGVFTLAEDYHQKYYLRKLEGVKELLNIKSNLELVNSPVATKLNAYMNGYGNFSEIEVYVLNIPDILQKTRDLLMSVLARYHQVSWKKGKTKCQV